MCREPEPESPRTGTLTGNEGPEEELASAHRRLISVLNSFTQMYDKARTVLDEAGRGNQISADYGNVYSGSRGQTACFWQSPPPLHGQAYPSSRRRALSWTAAVLTRGSAIISLRRSRGRGPGRGRLRRKRRTQQACVFRPCTFPTRPLTGSWERTSTLLAYPAC